jgi:sugar lactone lactonase YvrE
MHSALGEVAHHRWYDFVVDGRGYTYVNGFGFDFLGGAPPQPGIIVLVTPDGTARCVATDIDFPNGMVITPDNSTLVISESFAGRLTAFDIGADGGLSNRRVWADNVGPDGICLDAYGAVWCQGGRHPHAHRAPRLCRGCLHTRRRRRQRLLEGQAR